MSSNTAPIQGKRGSFGQYSAPNASLLLEKTKAGIRKSTPDSEALASSDDETDHLQRSMHVSAQQGPPVTRRPSWMNEGYHQGQRKSSVSGLDSFAPVSPHQTLPPQETTPWSSGGVTTSRGHSNSASMPWNNGIWNHETPKVLPSRFAEVLPSPTSLGPTGVAEESSRSPPPRRDSTSDAAIPFAIPLHPTLKSYRSQSYSVGQLDQETGLNAPNRTGQHAYTGRTRAGSSYTGLQHRPSRPSMLGEFSADGSVLSQLREVDDDEESTTSSDAGLRLSHTQARTIEQLAMENAILRQQALASQSIPAPTANNNFSAHMGSFARPGSRNLHISDSVLEEIDDGSLNEEDQVVHRMPGAIGRGGRRYSEYTAGADGQTFMVAAAEKRSVESLRKGHWQSSLGFGGLGEGAQSRRHSFADVPLRHSPLAPNLESGAIGEPRTHIGFSESPMNSGPPENASYFSSTPSRASDAHGLTNSHSAAQSNFNVPQNTRSQTFGQPQGHHGQSLYLVTFKAARAEFYYVQEGTGLEINAGDLVIVEADRGTDLGTVAHKNVDWASARELKEHYVAEHYNWLMMFSRQGQNGHVIANPNGAVGAVHSGKSSTSAIGGVGAPGQQSGTDALNIDIKPKMIKRLAQSHEIHTLREKEGNEAKAKRMCQQKVAEHHLNMEILDAEFQMDWKKLTFYYFADSYINFNSLVTDLFKIYKTRIWMSAINPASFVSPATGLQLSAGAIAGTQMLDRERYADRSRPDTHSFASMPLEPRYDVGWGDGRQGNLPQSVSTSYASYWPTQRYQQGANQIMEYGRALNVPVGTQPAFRPPSNLIGSSTQPENNTGYHDEVGKPPYADQLQSFQGLSLGTS